MIGIDDIRSAANRIEGHVRRTPMLEATQLKSPVTEAALCLKLELLQVTGSFKARGATNRLMSLPNDRLSNGIVAASGGNHGLAVARAAHLAGVPATIFLPENASPAKIEKLRLWNAETVVTGSFWNETNEEALAFARSRNAAYFHPFADPETVAGQGTLGLEILEQDPDVDTVLVAMGGGGLASGVGTAIKAVAPHVRVIGVEAAGSPVIRRSIDAGHPVALEEVTTKVATMACAQTDDRIIEIVKSTVDDIVLVDDAQMRAAAEWLWFEIGLAADLSGAAAVAALRQDAIDVRPDQRICAIICGAGPDIFV